MDVEDEEWQWVTSQFKGSLALALTGYYLWGNKVSPGATCLCWLLSIPFPREVFLWDLSLRAGTQEQNVTKACPSQSIPPLLKPYLPTALKQTKKSVIKIEKRLSVSLNLQEVSPFMVAEVCSHITLSKPSGYSAAAPFS